MMAIMIDRCSDIQYVFRFEMSNGKATMFKSEYTNSSVTVRLLQHCRSTTGCCFPASSLGRTWNPKTCLLLDWPLYWYSAWFVGCLSVSRQKYQRRSFARRPLVGCCLCRSAEDSNSILTSWLEYDRLQLSFAEPHRPDTSWRSNGRTCSYCRTTRIRYVRLHYANVDKSVKIVLGVSSMYRKHCELCCGERQGRNTASRNKCTMDRLIAVQETNSVINSLNYCFISQNNKCCCSPSLCES